jgi:hypothetical protein
MTRRVIVSVPNPSDNSQRRPLRQEGEPVVTAVWMTVSAATLVMGLSIPYLGAVDSPLQDYVVPTVAALYAFAMAATCAYNRLRYGRIWIGPLPPARARRHARGRPRLAAKRHAKAPLAVMIG